MGFPAANKKNFSYYIYRILYIKSRDLHSKIRETGETGKQGRVYIRSLTFLHAELGGRHLLLLTAGSAIGVLFRLLLFFL